MRFLWILSLFLILAGCKSNQQPPTQPAESNQALSAHGEMGGAAPAAPVNLLKGKVLERIDADRYSYLRLATDEGEIWAAVLQTNVKGGEEVAVVNPMLMDGFQSKTLNRTFDRIVFGTLQEPKVEDNKEALMKAHASIADASTTGPIDVDKASGPNGYTVEEIFARRLDLTGRKVAVRGKVTRVNPNILGKTWIHLQDGTGDSETRTNDLTVTSQGNASVGDTVLVEGVVGVDRNLGMGYEFPVIIEDATVTEQ